MNTRILSGVAGLSVAAIALVGCSAGEPVDLGDSGSSDSVLVAAIGGEPDQLDPQRTSSYFSFELSFSIDVISDSDSTTDAAPFDCGVSKEELRA